MVNDGDLVKLKSFKLLHTNKIIYNVKNWKQGDLIFTNDFQSVIIDLMLCNFFLKPKVSFSILSSGKMMCYLLPMLQDRVATNSEYGLNTEHKIFIFIFENRPNT